MVISGRVPAHLPSSHHSQSGLVCMPTCCPAGGTSEPGSSPHAPPLFHSPLAGKPSCLTHHPTPLAPAGATGPARRSKPTPVLVGSKRVVRNFSPRATSMLSLPYLMNWRRSPCRTRTFCTISCCRPVPQLSSKSLAIPNISVPSSASSACSTPRIKNSNITRTCTVSCPPAHYHWIPPIAFHHARASFFPSKSS